MTEMEARQVVAYCAAAYPGPPWGETSLRLWVHELVDLPFDAAMEGARWMVREKPNFPSVADVRAGAARWMARQDVERDRHRLLEAPAPSLDEQAETGAALSGLLASLHERLAAKGLQPAPKTAGKALRRRD